MIGDEFTKADSLGVFLTGAGSDGGSQSDPDLSLGNYRSSTRAELIGPLADGALKGIKIERVGPANGFGKGVIEAVDGNKLRWTAPGREPGEPVRIANGQTRLLEDPEDPTRFIIVSCNTTDELLGSLTVSLVPVFNNVIGMSNVSDSERQAGEIKLRCIALKCLNDIYSIRNLKLFLSTLGTAAISDGGQLGASGSGTITTTGSLGDWPDVGYCRIETSAGVLREIVYYESRTDTILTVPSTGRGLLGTTPAAGAATDVIYPVPGLKIAKEIPVSSQFSVADDENDTSEVSGFSWSTGITRDTGIFCGHLAKDEMIGLWLWMQIPAGAKASASLENIVNWEFGVYDQLAL